MTDNSLTAIRIADNLLTALHIARLTYAGLCLAQMHEQPVDQIESDIRDILAQIKWICPKMPIRMPVFNEATKQSLQDAVDEERRQDGKVLSEEHAELLAKVAVMKAVLDDRVDKYITKLASEARYRVRDPLEIMLGALSSDGGYRDAEIWLSYANEYLPKEFAPLIEHSVRRSITEAVSLDGVPEMISSIWLRYARASEAACDQAIRDVAAAIHARANWYAAARVSARAAIRVILPVLDGTLRKFVENLTPKYADPLKREVDRVVDVLAQAADLSKTLETIPSIEILPIISRVCITDSIRHK